MDEEQHDLQRRLRHLGTHPIDADRQAADLASIAAIARPAPPRVGFLGSKLRVAAAFLVGLIVGSTGLAAADALPDPAQHVAHNVLAQVGVDVPNPDRYHGPECGPEQKRNHGAYVRDDHSLAASDCGKPVGAGAEDGEVDEGQGNGDVKAPRADKGPCQGKPPWAGNKTMTEEEVAAAKAERAALCGADEDDADDGQDPSDAPTTTVPATTTTAPGTTTTEATTSTTAATTTTSAPTTSTTAATTTIAP